MGSDEGLKMIGMFENGVIWNNDKAKWSIHRTAFQNALNNETLRRTAAIARKKTYDSILKVREKILKRMHCFKASIC